MLFFPEKLKTLRYCRPCSGCAWACWLQKPCSCLPQNCLFQANFGGKKQPPTKKRVSVSAWHIVNSLKMMLQSKWQNFVWRKNVETKPICLWLFESYSQTLKKRLGFSTPFGTGKRAFRFPPSWGLYVGAKFKKMPRKNANLGGFRNTITQGRIPTNLLLWMLFMFFLCMVYLAHPF